MPILRRTGWYFLSSVSVPLLGLITLPIFTTRLGPEHYGVFALGSALAGIVSAAAGSVSTVSLPAEFGRLTDAERRHYVTAVLVLSLAVGLVTCGAVFGLYSVVSEVFSLEILTPTATTLAIAGALLNSLWAVCTEILTIDGRARVYSISTVLQALANALAVSAALFLFDEPETALFWGFLSAALMASIGAVFALRRSLVRCSLSIWLPIAARGGVAAITASLSETGKVAIERAYLGAVVGVGQLGLFAHAQFYKNASMVALNALSRGVWPTALQEARDPEPAFPATLRVWTMVQAFVVIMALGFALVGREVIGLLTHGKFVEAAPYAVALLLALLIQTAAKPHSSLLLSRGQGHLYAHLNTISMIVALAWLLVSVPFMGVWGVVSSIFVQVVIHRVGVFVFARRLYRLPFTDGWVFWGACGVIICAFLTTQMTLLERGGLFVGLLMATLWKTKPMTVLTWLSQRNH